MIDKKELEPLKRNAIVINYNEENREKIPKGSSKIGGKPDLPKDFQWYYYNGEDYKRKVANRPLSFLMQINCEEVYKYDKESLLPKKGILYFFYELMTMTWGFSPDDRGSARVFYYDGEIEDLVPTDFPEDMEEDCIIPEAKIDFESMNDYPIDFLDYYDDEDSNEEIRRKEKEIEKDVEIVKLGEDVNKNGYLKKEAIKRTIDCLKKYKEKADKFGASKVIAFATSATRDSQNREEFLSQVRDIGIDIRCIAGEREAQLNFLGNSIVFKDRILVLDIGGGSTEFTLGENGNIEFTKSINIGAVRGTERFFPEQNYTEESIEECRNWIKEMVSGVKFLKDDNFTLVGVAGTATTQISVQKQMEIYDSSEVHLSKINLDELRQNLQLFLSCDGEKRKEIVGLEAKRADVIIAGTIILIAIMEELGVDSMVVSESDNLNGAMISKEI